MRRSGRLPGDRLTPPGSRRNARVDGRRAQLSTALGSKSTALWSTWTEIVWAALRRAALDSPGLALDSSESMGPAARAERQVRHVRRRGSRRGQASSGASWASPPIG